MKTLKKDMTLDKVDEQVCYRDNVISMVRFS